ncbi:peptidase S8/S53 domain-containing protein [Pholiota molesta]|nr:peptidase S8/S53 domain-containing protein [Pholiota molesta]
MRSFTSFIIFSLFAATAVKAATLSSAVGENNGDTSAHLDDAALTAPLASPDVEHVSEDIANTGTAQRNAPWGLSRISSSKRLSGTDITALNYTYRYSTSAGSGVDVYVLSTGVYTAHNQFGGRASWGATFGGYASNDDKHGMGTHVAGTIAGTQFGVAKAAQIISVKCLGDNNLGTFSDVISGINWVQSRATGTGRPSIACLPWVAGGYPSLDNAVVALTTAGIHVVVAAGNNNTDAGSMSPPRVSSAVTVGASNFADVLWVTSDYGNVVKIFAPGEDIVSAGIGSPNAMRTMSGTEMAAAHVAGLIAGLISLEGNTTPAAMATKLQALARRNALVGIRTVTR